MYLLDLGPGDLARSARERLPAQRPTPFRHPADLRGIRPGSLAVDVESAVRRADGILEAAAARGWW